jgi:hypothetical protein
MHGLASLLVLLTAFIAVSLSDPSLQEDVFTPMECEKFAGFGDHVLLEWSLESADGVVLDSRMRPSAYAYLHMSHADRELPVMRALSGACLNATKKITWQSGAVLDAGPLLPEGSVFTESASQALSLTIHVRIITSQPDFAIFAPLRGNDAPTTYEIIGNRLGINAVDENSDSPLMIAIRNNMVQLVAQLLNSRVPRCDVNYVKYNGYTALIYAIFAASNPFLVELLLRRGADPSQGLLQAGSRGNTPLHIACKLERQQQAELLIKYVI